MFDCTVHCHLALTFDFMEKQHTWHFYIALYVFIDGLHVFHDARFHLHWHIFCYEFVDFAFTYNIPLKIERE